VRLIQSESFDDRRKDRTERREDNAECEHAKTRAHEENAAGARVHVGLPLKR
jgi:hypothetical protein